MISTPPQQPLRAQLSMYSTHKMAVKFGGQILGWCWPYIQQNKNDKEKREKFGVFSKCLNFLHEVRHSSAKLPPLLILHDSVTVSLCCRCSTRNYFLLVVCKIIAGIWKVLTKHFIKSLHRKHFCLAFFKIHVLWC